MEKYPHNYYLTINLTLSNIKPLNKQNLNSM